MSITVKYICDVCEIATTWVLVAGVRLDDQPKPHLKYINGRDVCPECEAKIEFEVREVEKVSA